MSFRRAYKLKYKAHSLDPFYNISYKNKVKIYKQKFSSLVANIDDNVLLFASQALTTDQIEEKLARFENVQMQEEQHKEYIALLKSFYKENLKCKANNLVEKIKVCQFIYERIETLIKLEISSFDIFS